MIFALDLAHAGARFVWYGGSLYGDGAMPRGPKGEKRPADVIGTAVLVAKIATGEVEEETGNTGKEYARKGGLKGGRKRAQSLTPERRREIARLAAKKRWGE